MIMFIDSIVKGFYVGNAMVAVQLLPGGGILPLPWLKCYGGLLYLGVGDGLMARVA